MTSPNRTQQPLPDTSALAIVAVVGPTATGKSTLAVELARRLGGEVVNADAMAFYRGMDVGTAKLSHEQRRGVAHHQIDVLDVTQPASLAAYQAAARADVAAIKARHHRPVVVGGSGLYVRALLDRLDIPPTDAAVRARLQEELDRCGVEMMHRRLRALDPAAAERIEGRNARRIVRALEVLELTGRPFRAALPPRLYAAPTVTIGLTLPRPVLDERIEARVARMWRAGLVEEVEGLLARGLARGPTARTALGYAQALGQLAGELTPQEARQQTTGATKRYARRQESWFRPDERVRWLPAEAADLTERALAVVAEHAGGQ